MQAEEFGLTELGPRALLAKANWTDATSCIQKRCLGQRAHLPATCKLLSGRVSFVNVINDMRTDMSRPPLVHDPDIQYNINTDSLRGADIVLRLHQQR